MRVSLPRSPRCDIKGRGAGLPGRDMCITARSLMFDSVGWGADPESKVRAPIVAAQSPERDEPDCGRLALFTGCRMQEPCLCNQVSQKFRGHEAPAPRSTKCESSTKKNPLPLRTSQGRLEVSQSPTWESLHALSLPIVIMGIFIISFRRLRRVEQRMDVTSHTAPARRGRRM
jgi:hypothetical protein